MERTAKAQYIIGCISLLSNKLTQFGDDFLPDLTFKQWFLLMMISKMGPDEIIVNSIADFVGTTRQNVKKMLLPLSDKGYITMQKSKTDARALSIILTRKAKNYLIKNAALTDDKTEQLFAEFSDDQLNSLVSNLRLLLQTLSE